MDTSKPVLAIIGGTGAEGSGLGLRWANSGYSVILGSRSAERAAETANALNAQLGRQTIEALENLAAVKKADIVILTVPFAAQRSTVEALAEALKGKILVDVTVPLVPPKVNRVQLPAGGSAVAALQNFLGEDVKVVSAFQNVSAHHLKDLDHDPECDVIVCGDDPQSVEAVITLAAGAGLRGFYGGALVNSVVAEAMTSVLIAINQKYKIKNAGIRITGVPTS